MTREEAIEVYNGLINTKIKEAFEFFAPELRESEDERIRKGLIREFQSIKSPTWGRVNAHDVLVWLEKQKEQKSLEPKDIDIRAMVDVYRCTDEYDNEGNLKGKPVNCMIRAYEQGIRDILKIVKQKPAEWSEEDEKTINDAIRLIERYAIDGHKKALREDVIGRLKPLRPHWKPSEEQMAALAAAKIGVDTDYELLESLYDDLKKLLK